jgi:hypothetical protein
MSGVAARRLMASEGQPGPSRGTPMPWLGLATVASAIVLSWGWYHERDGMPFSRSGALVTAIAVIFVLSRYAKVLADRERQISEEVRETLRDMDIGGRLAKQVSGKIEDYVHSHSVLMDRLITYWQVAILVTGTLVWGFGDLVVQVKKLPWSDIAWRLFHLGAPLNS